MITYVAKVLGKMSNAVRPISEEKCENMFNDDCCSIKGALSNGALEVKFILDLDTKITIFYKTSLKVFRFEKSNGTISFRKFLSFIFSVRGRGRGGYFKKVTIFHKT